MKLFFSYTKDHTCRLLIPKIIVKIFNTIFKMETLKIQL